MLIDNFIKLNDWQINKFIWLIIIIQLSLWGLLGLGFIGINIPFIREIIGFIYLIYVPGIILLRILGLHKLSNIETLLLTISLSMATLMFIGLIINIILPLWGMEEPLSFVPLLLSINLFSLFLLLLSYFIDKDFIQPKLNIEISSKHLFLILPLFLSIFGTYLINYHDNNLVIIFMIITIAIIIFLVGFNKIDKSLYSFVILIISISLLFHNSLISNYISGFDIQREFFISKLVIYNLRWETLPSLMGYADANSILSITVLPSYFYNISNIDVIWLYKIIYPLIFCLVPLGLFELFKRQFNSKIAFFSVIYFVTSYSFFYNMLQLMRQIIGEIFLVAIILVFLDNKMDKKSRSILLIILLFSLTVSHYALAYIFLAVLIGVYLLQFLVNSYKKQDKANTISSSLVLLFLTSVLIWYLYSSNSSVFVSILNIFDRIYETIFANFLSPQSTQSLSIITMKNTFLNALTKYLHLLTQLLIVVGIVGIFFNFRNIKSKFKIKKAFIYFAILNLVVCISCIVVPNLSNQLDTIRIYQITIIVLSPFLVIGFMLVIAEIHNILKLVNSNENFPKIFKITNIFKSNKSYPNVFSLISIFLIIFLLFNTGLVQEINNEPYKPTMALSSATDPPIFNEKDLLSAEWLTNYKSNDSETFSDVNGFVLLGGFVGPKSGLLVYNIDKNVFNDISDNSYIYLRSSTSDEQINVAQDSIKGTMEGFIDQKFLTPVMENRIYDNDVVYYLND